MNFCSPAISFKNDEDYNILDCSSHCEIDQEEITDTSSPECSGKRYQTSALGIFLSNKKKNSVKRKLLLQKPFLDTHSTNSNLSVRSEGHFQRIKRKKLSTDETNLSNENHVQNNVKEISMQYGISLGPELQESNYNPTYAALTAGLIKPPSLEIFSEEDSKVKSDLYISKEEIICSQDSSGNISSEDEKQLSIKSFYETSDPKNTIGNEGNDHDIKEEIICSQDSLNYSIKNNKYIIESAKLIEALGPSKILQEEDEEDKMSNIDIHEEEIICSQNSTNECFQNFKENDVFNESSSPKILLYNEEEEDKMLNSDIHKEEIICSQNSTNECFQNFKKNDVFNESSSPKILLYNEDGKDHSYFDKSEEDIIYSQDSDTNIFGIGHNLFSNACDANIPSSPSKFSIQEGKQEENIEFDGSEIDDSSERDPYVTLASSSSSLQKKIIVEKMEAATYSSENKPNNNVTISSPMSNNDISSLTELNDPNSEFLVKAPKKGTMLQRAYNIISDLKKEANLLSYEIQVGLRASKGALVSEPLIIHNIYFEEKNYIISCKPLNIKGINNRCQVEESIYLVISNLTMDMRINSVIVVHFPLVALFGLPVMRIILFAENRVQVISSNRVTGSIDISLPNLIIGPRDQKLICVIKKNNSKTVIDAIVDQLFGKSCSVELKLLHIFKQRTVTHTVVELLTVDSGNQFCLVKYSEYNSLKDLNLELNNSYIFFGFTLTCSEVNNKVKSAAEYYSSSKFNNGIIYIVEPCIDSWKINHSSKRAVNPRNRTSLNSVIRNRTNHERIEILMKDYKVLENTILIKDESSSEMIELQFDEECCEHKGKLISLSVPVALCGIYFLNGCLYYDKYSQLMVL